MPLFITFEGGEGCGKSTQTRVLQDKLEKLAVPSIRIREPGGTALGERVRYILKQSTQIQISALTELILFNASRSQLVSEVILPNLNSGKTVICDRFADSTVAYQSYARGLDITTVLNMNRIATQGLKPDLTILLDIAPEIGLSRKPEGANDRFEKEKLAFHRKVRVGFLDLAAKEPGRWVVIDATLPRRKIAGLIWDEVSERLNINSQILSGYSG
jgi:dTMP kinase